MAGRRLGVPKSTVCSMFVRFRRAGLSWPLPSGMSEQELDACLYGQFSTVQSYVLKAPLYPSPRGKKTSRRPNFPYEFKIALVEQSLQPGACVAQIARENGINDNLLFNWRHHTGKVACCLPEKYAGTASRDVNAGAGYKIPAPARNRADKYTVRQSVL
nr:IS66-like element accessory protein TnpA [Shigella flexneri]